MEDIKSKLIRKGQEYDKKKDITHGDAYIRGFHDGMKEAERGIIGEAQQRIKDILNRPK